MSTSAMAWHYTAGWGNLFTVAVASIALVSSIVFSTITLRRNAQLSARIRDEARVDNLKAELVELINAVAERKPRGDMAMSRMRRELADGPGSPDASIAQQRALAVLAEHLWGIHRQITTHALGALMLTDEDDVIRPVERILRALAEGRTVWEGFVVGRIGAGELSGSDDDALRLRTHSVDEIVNAATEELVSYCLLRLGVLQNEDVAGILGALDLAAHDTLPARPGDLSQSR